MIDGTLDFSGGVNSIKVSTIASDRNMGGLRRNELAWMVNAAVRDGGVRPRTGWLNNGSMMNLTVGRFQGAFMYHPTSGEDPYMILAIGGHIYRADPDNPEGYQDLSTRFGLTMPIDQPQTYFCQAEQFLVIQAGDYVTLPLFWDGGTLRRSNGIIISGGTAPKASSVNSVTIQNISASPNVKVPANAVSAPVGVSAPSGGTYTGQFGPTVAEFTTPAIGASVTIEVSQPYKYSIGAKVGISRTVFINQTGDWTVTAATSSDAGFPAGVPLPEIPAAGPMDYFMGRIWYAQGTQVIAGDIVRGTSGTAAYNLNDSVLRVTENPLAIGGDGFAIPSNDGNIRALKHSANIDAALGEGRLYIFSRRAAYALTVPVTRDDWTGADYNNGPLLSVVQLYNGSVGDRCVVSVNGDLYYKSIEPSIRSLVTATRFFGQPGNVDISANENRLLRFEDRALLYASSGVYFNNRLLMTCLPTDTPSGVTFSALAPLDFLPVSGLNQQSQPVWEGMYQGLSMFEVLQGDFGGLDRAFAVIASDTDHKFAIWELSQASRRDNVDSRITFQFESPAFTWGDEGALKKLIGGELWVDQVSGTVNFTLHYRPDSDSCWHLWHTWQACNTANSCEDPINPVCYPTTPNPDTYRAMMAMPVPPAVCNVPNQRPSNLAYQFQVRLTIVGWCRVRGLWLHASPFERSIYSRIQC